jgi:hypothetical protein
LALANVESVSAPPARAKGSLIFQVSLYLKKSDHFIKKIEGLPDLEDGPFGLIFHHMNKRKDMNPKQT